MDYFEGYRCGLTSLPCPAGDYAFAGAVEQCGLVWEEVEAEDGFCEECGLGSEFVSKIGEWF